MFSRKIALLAAGYIAGNLVSSLYSDKKGKDLRKTAIKAKKAGENEKSVIINNLIDTHRVFFDDMKSLLSEENQKLLETKKSDILTIVSDYKKQGDKLVEEFGGKSTTLGSKLQKLYDEKKGDIKKHLHDVSPEEFKKISDKLFTQFDSFMGKLKTEPVKKTKKPTTKKKTIAVVSKAKTVKKKVATKTSASAKVKITKK